MTPDRRVLDPAFPAEVRHYDGAFAVSAGDIADGRGLIGPMSYEEAMHTKFVHDLFNGHGAPADRRNPERTA